MTSRLGFGEYGGPVWISNRAWNVKATASQDVMWMVAMLERDWRQEIVSAPRPFAYSVGMVRDGGTLRSIAHMFYGDTNGWRAIYDANRTTITNSEKVATGTRLTIPELK